MGKEDNLKKALELLETDMLDAYPDMESLPKHEFSDCYLEQMKGIEDIAKNRIDKVTRRKRFLKIASILFCIFISIAGIGAIYAMIKDWIAVEIVHYEKNSDLIYHIKDETRPTLNKIKDFYVPGWLPEGYEVAEEEKNSVRLTLKYVNENSDTLLFQQMIFDESVQNLNFENITFENLTLLNGSMEAVYYQTSGTHRLLCIDGIYQYILMGAAEKEILIQIAESIQLK